ncbi:MAG: hypothetical protein CSA95_00055 [Bacteroidetes bacterium]|nr:MAG: hypothetical protein CSA95_00055 [Bacteroidota bacterium]
MKMNNLSQKHVGRLTLFLITLSIVFALMGLSRWLAKPEVSVKRVERVLHRQERLAEEIASHVRTEAEGSPYIFEGESSTLIRENEFHGFLFYESTLTFWSDSRVAVDKESLGTVTSDTLLYSGNQISYCKVWSWDRYRFYLLIPIKQAFHYENQYLENTFSLSYRLHPDTRVVVDKAQGFPIYNANNRYLFSLLFSETSYTYPALRFLILLGYFVSLVLLSLFIIALYRHLSPFQSRPLLRVIFYVLDMALLYGLLKWLHPSDFLPESLFFDPSLFAHNAWIANLNDLLILSVFFFFIAYMWYGEFRQLIEASGEVRHGKIGVSVVFMAMGVSVVYYSFVLIHSLVVNSSISFDLSMLFDLNFYSVVGFFLMVLLMGASWMFVISIIRYLKTCGWGIGGWILFAAVFSLLFVVVNVLFLRGLPLIFSIATVLFVLFCGVKFLLWRDRMNAGLAVLVIAALAMLCSLVLNDAWEENRRSEMRMIALSVSNQRDRVAEFLFEDWVEQMKSDSQLHHLAQQAVYNVVREDSLMGYLKERYLSGYWKQFDYQVTVCDEYVDLSLQEEAEVMNCEAYFSGIRNRYGLPTFGDHLYFINDSSGMVSYLGQVPLLPSVDSADTVTLYIDIIPKYIREGLGYPELMIDDQFQSVEDYGRYSWAMFLNGSLVRSVGSYFYSSKLARYAEVDAEDHFFHHNENDHYLYHAGEGMTILITRPRGGIIDNIVPFSYLFLFFSLVIVLLYGLFLLTRRGISFKFTIRNRLQLFVTGFLFIALSVVGVSSVRYIWVLNKDKNSSYLQEKAHSVLTELEHKLSNEKLFDENLYSYLSMLLSKWSNVFFSDINLYSPNGELIVSSRREIFEDKLTSTRMDPSAYKALALDRKMQYITREQIGHYVYLSAWVQFRNANNELVAYLNLPFFARQSELSQKVSEFLITFINIYVLLIVIALLLGLLFSNIISKPLVRIRDTMAKLSLGGDNEKLKWSRDDEIGALVKEYNAKVDELDMNAEKLAQTERESAWREMAKQVAHEIKNPLTPMKLSVQYLKRAWDDRAPDFDQRFDRFSSTMIEQIDSMAEIATAFSDFARMPKAQLEVGQLNDLIRNAIDLYDEATEFTIAVQLTEEDTAIFADGKQLLRVFHNLIKNAFQAMGDQEKGCITIKTWREENSVMVSFADNGPGIPEEQAEKIFAPNFTTKSGGMGLGLAMVKNIVLNHGGQIWFESGEETVFYIVLPAYEGV